MKIIKVQDFIPVNNQNFSDNCSNVVKDILDSVQNKGDKALFEFTKKFDSVELTNLKVDKEALNNCYQSFTKDQLEPMMIAADRIRAFHKNGLLKSWRQTDADGTILGQNVTAIQRVGVYIPGGTAAYPSSVLMTIIPAQIAGVKEIAVVSPPAKDRLPHRSILATLAMLKIDEVYTIGGAQAIAALAFGTETIKAVDKIVGPGNSYVAEAKRQVFGTVGIDIPAGPSEVMIYCNIPGFDRQLIIRDIFAQAEHDVLASCILVTPCQNLAEDIVKLSIAEAEKCRRADIVKEAIKNNCSVVLVENDAQAAEVINKSAPEHLQLFGCSDELEAMILNAGSIFKGEYSSAVMGDYIGGPNHTLPTGRMARFASGLTANDFLKVSSFSQFSEMSFQKLAPRVIRFAEMEQLFAHADAIDYRLNKD